MIGYSDGPWTFDEDAGYVRSPEGGVLARVPHAICANEIDFANGRIMAAGAELYEAAVAVLAHRGGAEIAGTSRRAETKAWDALQRAICKAEGRDVVREV